MHRDEGLKKNERSDQSINELLTMYIEIKKMYTHFQCLCGSNMPLYYHFLDRNGETVALDKIDEELCKDLNTECPQSTFSTEFELLTMVGDYSYREGYFSNSAFIFASTTLPDDMIVVFLDYLNGKYKYESWRSWRI